MVTYVRRLGAAGAGEKATGDPNLGRVIYEGKGGCAACHAVKEKGGRLGPDLTDIGLRRSLKFLRDSVTDPELIHRPPVSVGGSGNAGMERKSGALFLNEDDYSIQLRDMREELRSFLKSDLTEIRVERESLMPAYKDALSDTGDQRPGRVPEFVAG